MRPSGGGMALKNIEPKLPTVEPVSLTDSNFARFC